MEEKKRYVDELARWVKKRKAQGKTTSSITHFLALRDDIEAALEAGYPVKTIWEHLSETGKYTHRYETFARLVRKFIKSNPGGKSGPKKVSAEKKGLRWDSKPDPDKLL
jgi:Family of unknown function (DUF5338)